MGIRKVWWLWAVLGMGGCATVPPRALVASGDAALARGDAAQALADFRTAHRLGYAEGLSEEEMRRRHAEAAEAFDAQLWQDELSLREQQIAAGAQMAAEGRAREAVAWLGSLHRLATERSYPPELVAQIADGADAAMAAVWPGLEAGLAAGRVATLWEAEPLIRAMPVSSRYRARWDEGRKKAAARHATRATELRWTPAAARVHDRLARMLGADETATSQAIARDVERLFVVTGRFELEGACAPLAGRLPTTGEVSVKVTFQRCEEEDRATVATESRPYETTEPVTGYEPAYRPERRCRPRDAVKCATRGPMGNCVRWQAETTLEDDCDILQVPDGRQAVTRERVVTRHEEVSVSHRRFRLVAVGEAELQISGRSLTVPFHFDEVLEDESFTGRAGHVPFRGHSGEALREAAVERIHGILEARRALVLAERVEARLATAGESRLARLEALAFAAMVEHRLRPEAEALWGAALDLAGEDLRLVVADGTREADVLAAEIPDPEPPSLPPPTEAALLTDLGAERGDPIVAQRRDARYAVSVLGGGLEGREGRDAGVFLVGLDQLVELDDGLSEIRYRGAVGTAGGFLLDLASELGGSSGSETLRLGLYGGLGAELLAGGDEAFGTWAVTVPLSARARWHFGLGYIAEAGLTVALRLGSDTLRTDEGTRSFDGASGEWRLGGRVGGFGFLPLGAALSLKYVDFGRASMLTAGLAAYF